MICFFYTASDGTITSEPVEVGVRVAAAQDVPIAAADTYTLDEDTPLNVDVANGLLANDIDPDSETLTAAVVNQPTNGTLVLSGDGSLYVHSERGFRRRGHFSLTQLPMVLILQSKLR